MEVLRSALRHGVDPEDIHHVLRNALVVEEVAEDSARYLVLGADRAGKLLEFGGAGSAPGSGGDARNADESEVPDAATEGVVRDLLLRAAQEHISVSEVIRRAIAQYLRAG